MNRTSCPNCGEDILDLAYPCSNCGWIDTKRINQSNFSLVAALALLLLAVGTCSFVPAADLTTSIILAGGGAWIVLFLFGVLISLTTRATKTALKSRKAVPLPAHPEPKSPYPRNDIPDIQPFNGKTWLSVVGGIGVFGLGTICFRGNDLALLQISLVSAAFVFVVLSARKRPS